MALTRQLIWTSETLTTRTGGNNAKGNQRAGNSDRGIPKVGSSFLLVGRKGGSQKALDTGPSRMNALDIAF